jgi:hypothetical protein
VSSWLAPHQQRYLVQDTTVTLQYTKERVMGRVKDLLMDILRMYNQGWTVSEIANITGVPVAEVERLLTAQGVI